MPSATVAICTHNRAALLGRAVAAALVEAAGAGSEVLVVDNASTDDTPRVLAGLVASASGRLRRAVEPVLGLSAARNRALAEARGPVVAYLDDDAVPRPGWLAALVAPYATPAVACVGGRVVLAFDGSPPAWLTPFLRSALSAYDAGDTARRLRWQPGDEFPYGANISFRAAAARAVGGFSPWVGPRGGRTLVHDETDLCYRLDHAGGEVHYAPGAVVDHWILADRLTPAWFLARHRDRGHSGALFTLRNRGLRRALGRVRWHHGRDLLALPWAPRAPVDPARLERECRRQEALGYLAGLVRGVAHLRALQAGGAVGWSGPGLSANARA